MVEVSYGLCPELSLNSDDVLRSSKLDLALRTISDITDSAMITHQNGSFEELASVSNVVDLFAAQTAMILSFAAQLLEGVLHPDLIDRVRREVERRIFRPFMDYDGEWWMGFTRTNLNNWTPWIISNVLMSANVWHWGGAALIERACGMLDRWLKCVPEDGGCDEGAGYWNMAGGAFLDCLMALESMAGVNLWQAEKVRRMMASRNMTVTYLQRQMEGTLTLGDLPMGQTLELTARQVEELEAQCR